MKIIPTKKGQYLICLSNDEKRRLNEYLATAPPLWPIKTPEQWFRSVLHDNLSNTSKYV